MHEIIQIKRVLLSVSDKSGLIEFAKALHEQGAELLSTGGTAKAIKEAGIPVKDVSAHTGFPEMMDGRIKTLHPKVHGGLLMRRGQDDEIASEHGITPIDMIVINLYPFQETVAKEGVSEEEAIEQIDIGGPAMLRSGAKNFKWVASVTDVKDYNMLIKEIAEHGGLSLKTRRMLALKVFKKTSAYDQAIYEYLEKQGQVVELLDLHYEKIMSLRYGENPHQKAAFFRDPSDNYANVTNAKVLQGKQLSYNNIIDADGALELVKDFEEPAVAFIKHTNPCGVATAHNINDAFPIAHQVDTASAFGSVIAVNREFTKEMAEYIKINKIFVEIIIAPSFAKEAMAILEKRENLRLLETGALNKNPNQRNIKSVGGGLLIQTMDDAIVKKDDLKLVTNLKPDDTEIQAMLFARVVAKHVKSNAVIFAKTHDKGGCITTGIGAGQMSRVDSVIIARKKGGANIDGSVMASEAFFPFADSIEQAHEAKVSAIIQPGGSMRDDEVIQKADELGIKMVFTGVRNFKH